MNISAPAGSVRIISQGSTPKPQFASFAPGPQNTAAPAAPTKKGATASNGDSSITSTPVFTLQKDFLPWFSILLSPKTPLLKG